MITKNSVADVAFWEGVDTDQQQIDTSRAVTAATVALSGTWPFLAAAQSAEEFEHRLALMSGQIEAQTPPEVLGEVVAGLRDKFTVLHTARLTETTLARTAARTIALADGQVALPDAYVHVHKHGSGDDEYHQVDHVAGQGFLNTVAHTGDHDEAMAKARQYAQATSLPLYENGRYVEGHLVRSLFQADEEFFDQKTGRWVKVSELPNIQRTGAQIFRPGGGQGIGLSAAAHERLNSNWGDSLNPVQAATQSAPPNTSGYQPDPDGSWRYKYPGVNPQAPGGGSPVNPVPGPGVAQPVTQTSIGPDGFPLDYAQGEDRSTAKIQEQITPGTWVAPPGGWPASGMPNAATGQPEGVRPGARTGSRQGPPDFREASKGGGSSSQPASIYCPRCGGQGMRNMGGAIRNCTTCKGTGIRRAPRQMIDKDLGKDFLGDHEGSRRQARGSYSYSTSDRHGQCVECGGMTKSRAHTPEEPGGFPHCSDHESMQSQHAKYDSMAGNWDEGHRGDEGDHYASRRQANSTPGLTALLTNMKDGDRRSVSTQDGRNSYMVGYHSEQAMGDDNKPARGYTVGAYDVTHEQSGQSLGYYRHTPHGPTLMGAKGYAAGQAADTIARHARDQSPHSLGSRRQAVEGIVPTPGPNPNYFSQGNQGLQGPAEFPEDPSSAIEPKTDNRSNDLYGAVPPQVSSGTVSDGTVDGEGYARHASMQHDYKVGDRVTNSEGQDLKVTGVAADGEGVSVQLPSGLRMQVSHKSLQRKQGSSQNFTPHMVIHPAETYSGGPNTPPFTLHEVRMHEGLHPRDSFTVGHWPAETVEHEANDYGRRYALGHGIRGPEARVPVEWHPDAKQASRGRPGFSQSAGERISAAQHIDPEDYPDARELAESAEADRIRELRMTPEQRAHADATWGRPVHLPPHPPSHASRRTAYDEHDRAAEADDARLDQHMEWQHLSGEHSFEPHKDCWVCQQGYGKRTASDAPRRPRSTPDAPSGNAPPYFKPGDHVEDHRGDTAIVHTVIPSSHPGKSHRVQVTWDDPGQNRGEWEWAPGGGGFSGKTREGQPGDSTPYYQHVFRHHVPEIGSMIDEAVPNEGDIRRAYGSTNGQIVGKCDHCGEPVRYHTESGGHLQHLHNASPRCKDGRTATAMRVWMGSFEARMKVGSKSHFNPGHGGPACGAGARWDSKTISTTTGTAKVDCEACKRTQAYQQAHAQHTGVYDDGGRRVSEYMQWAHGEGHDPDEVGTLKQYQNEAGVSRAHADHIADQLYIGGGDSDWRRQAAVLENPTADNPSGRGGDPYRAKTTWEGFEHQRPRQQMEGDGGMNANTPTTPGDATKTGPNVNSPSPGLNKDGPRERDDQEEEEDDDE